MSETPVKIQEIAQKFVDDLYHDIQQQLATLGYVIVKDGKVLDFVSDKEAFHQAEQEFLKEENEKNIPISPVFAMKHQRK